MGVKDFANAAAPSSFLEPLRFSWPRSARSGRFGHDWQRIGIKVANRMQVAVCSLYLTRSHGPIFTCFVCVRLPAFPTLFDVALPAMISGFPTGNYSVRGQKRVLSALIRPTNR